MDSFIRRALHFLAWKARINRQSLRADLFAGLVSAIIVLPQGVAFATLAGLPPEYGLYGAMVPAIVGALWGSSWHLVSGPTNATSLMVFATLGAIATPFSPHYVALVLTLNLMVGLIKLSLGLARLGALVNFISTTVIVGFTAGAALLIIGAQLKNFFGLVVPQQVNFIAALTTFVDHVREIEPWVTAVGVVTLVAALVGKHYLPKVPHLLSGIVVGAIFAFVLAKLGLAQVATLGPLPSAIPPFSVPDLAPQTWHELVPVALALTVIGLTEAISSGRAVAVKSGQRIDGNQEFIGQGLANIAGAFTSSYPTSGSFNRTGANYESGARTPLAAVFSAFMLFFIVLLVAPLAAYLPIASMAAVLFLVAWGLVDIDAIRRILRTSRGETFTLAMTFVATLTIRLEAAIFVGVLISLFMYLNRTTHPRLTRVAPQPRGGRFLPAGETTPLCPQLEILRVDGSLFFGAVDHVREELDTARGHRPAIRHMLLIGSGINFVDAAGAELLGHEARGLREAGITLWLAKLKPEVRDVLERSGVIDTIGRDHVCGTKEAAIATIYATLDSAVCAACRARIFNECQVVLPDGKSREPARPELELTPPQSG